MASSEGIPDFGLFMEVQPDGTSLTFYDFCKVFFLGDLTEVVKLSTFGYARTLADDLDPEQSSPENRLKYIGDPVKQAMLLQILRNFPYLASVPLIITLSLFIASFAKFTIPFIRRFSTLIGQLSGPQRKKRDVDGSIDGILRIPGHLKNITAPLSLALEGVEYMAHQDTISQDFFSDRGWQSRPKLAENLDRPRSDSLSLFRPGHWMLCPILLLELPLQDLWTDHRLLQCAREGLWCRRDHLLQVPE